jgi:hypothetical protein
MATVLILRETPTAGQLAELLEPFGSFIKLAVDIRRELVAAGGELHYDCEQALLEDGSQQIDVWGADWEPDTRRVYFEALINIRPKQQNFSTELASPQLREQVDRIVRQVFEGANT